jgi:glycosyltransferase 2 family protein
MAVMAQQAGVAAWAATASAVVLQALAIGTGAGLVGLTGAVALEAAHPGARAALALLVAASALGVGLVMWPPFMRRLLALAKLTPEAAAPRPGGVLIGIVANIVAWTGYGVALWLLARGLLPDARLDLATAIAVFTASYLAGFLALLAPGGLGVREGVFIVMLQPSLGLGAATVLALASRVLLTLTELGAAAPFLLLSRRTPRVAL